MVLPRDWGHYPAIVALTPFKVTPDWLTRPDNPALSGVSGNPDPCGGRPHSPSARLPMAVPIPRNYRSSHGDIPCMGHMVVTWSALVSIKMIDLHPSSLTHPSISYLTSSIQAETLSFSTRVRIPPFGRLVKWLVGNGNCKRPQGAPCETRALRPMTSDTCI